MKRRELIKHIEHWGATFVREGRRHSIYRKNKYITEIPRHSEISNELARKICLDLFIPLP